MKLKDFDKIIDTIAATPHCDFAQALLIMNNAPTVDAVPVVRCKDCDFYQDDCSCGLNGGAWWAPVDYCSCGERMEDAEK